jgi:hypothetical protein
LTNPQPNRQEARKTLRQPGEGTTHVERFDKRSLEMITPTVTATDLDRCLYCRKPILTAFIYLPAVKGTDLVAPAHARCHEIATEPMTPEERENAKAEHLAGLKVIEAFFLPATADQVPA